MCFVNKKWIRGSYFLRLLLLSGHMDGSFAVVLTEQRGYRLEGRIEMVYEEVERESSDFNPFENLLEWFYILCLDRT